jgi:hypothetical protein
VNSPFWYRGYYENEEKYKIGVNQIDSTLNIFNIKHIVTGHTIVADTISKWFNNKVINVDTKHAEGKSEALYIDNGRYYRVNINGERILLFRDEHVVYNKSYLSD